MTASFSLIAEGTSVRTEDLVLEGPKRSMPMSLGFEVGGSWPFRLTATGQQLDSDLTLTAFADRPGLLSGPLDLDADLRGELAGASSFRDALAGRVSLRIAPGELRGISILEATFRTHDPEAARSEIERSGGSRDRSGSLPEGLDRFYGDTFDSLSATLQLGQGLARTEDFKLVTPFYSFEMEGTIRLEDLGLDAKGQLQLGEDLLKSMLGLTKLPGALPGLVIPLPAIRGTLADPKPEADWGHFWRTLLTNLPGVRLIKKIGEKLPGR
jgi:hypothetical protein